MGKSKQSGVSNGDKWTCFAIIELATGDMVWVGWDRYEACRWLYTQNDFPMQELRIIRGDFVSRVSVKPKPAKGDQRGKGKK